MSCQRLIASFEDCSRKHPVEARYLCKHLEAAVAWCLIASVCPDEGALQRAFCSFPAVRQHQAATYYCTGRLVICQAESLHGWGKVHRVAYGVVSALAAEVEPAQNTFGL